MLFQLVFVIKYFIWLQMEKYILLHREIITVIKLQMVTTHFVLKNTRKKWMIFLCEYLCSKIHKWPNTSTMQCHFYFTLWDLCIRASKIIFCGFFQKYIYLKFENISYYIYILLYYFKWFSCFYFCIRRNLSMSQTISLHLQTHYKLR